MPDDNQAAASPDPKSLVASLAKGLRVLAAFEAGRPALTITEAAKATGLDHGTVFRLLQTLQMLGYVERLPDSRAFRLTLKVLDLGFAALAQLDVRGAAQPELRALVNSLGHAASLGVLDRDEVVYVERVQESGVRLGVDIRVGSRVSAPVTAIGQAILAYLPPGQAARILAMRDRAALPAHLPKTPEALAATLAAVRARGYAVADGDTIAGLRVLAAPILGADGSAIAAISIASPGMQAPLEDHVAAAAPALLAAAARISRALAASGQTIAARDDAG